jgi:hypothetical protein
VATWRKRATVEDLRTGPREPHSTVLTDEVAAVVALRRHTLLPLDDGLSALQPAIPDLTRSALHRCLQRQGISRLPDVEGDKPKRQTFKRYAYICKDRISEPHRFILDPIRQMPGLDSYCGAQVRS